MGTGQRRWRANQRMTFHSLPGQFTKNDSQPQSVLRWEIHRQGLWSGVIAFLGILQFVVVVLTLMQYYPDGYQLDGHFLSDLGRSKTAGGNDNGLGSTAFSISLAVVGCSLLPFFYFIPRSFSQMQIWYWTVGGLIVSGLLGISLTPVNQYYVHHHLALLVWLTGMLGLMAGLLLHRELGWVRFLIHLAADIPLAWALIGYTLSSSHEGHVIFQKVVVLVAAVWLQIVVVTLSVTCRQESILLKEIVDQQAEGYLQTGGGKRVASG